MQKKEGEENNKIKSEINKTAKVEIINTRSIL